MPYIQKGYSGTWGGQTALLLKDFIRKAAWLGYDSIELAVKRPHVSPLDLSKNGREEIKQFIDQPGLLYLALPRSVCRTIHASRALRTVYSI